ncbi:MAG: DUF2752 domain-containing protein [Bacteroidetes bacterium]|nr:DUF2752 domain-containing protein [Bacteroidota bacterium]
MFAYIKNRRLLTALIVYFIVAIVLFQFFQVDIFIPCLYHHFTGRECWGCGTTRAGLALMQFDFRLAWQLNPLIYFIAPGAISLIIFDIVQFEKK